MAGNRQSFSSFFTALQRKLPMELAHRELTETVWLVHAETLPFDVVYYQLAPEHQRIHAPHTCRYLHIDEDTWVTKGDLLLNRIAALAGHARRIYARATVVARIDKTMAMAFQHAHHLQVPLPGKYRFGLFYHGELVAVSVFSGGRKMANKPEKYRSFELLRFCHKQAVHVVGGFSKLLEAFRQAVDPGDVMTYADKDWSDGTRYQQVGFDKVGETESQLFWVDTNTLKRYHERMLPDGVRGETDENRRKSGYLPIHNSGSIKLVKTYHP